MQATFFVIKSTTHTNFTNLFFHETLHVSDSFSVHHQSLFNVHSAMAYVILVCRQLSSRTGMELQFHPVPARKLYDIAECTVNKFLMMGRGNVRNMSSFMTK